MIDNLEKQRKYALEHRHSHTYAGLCLELGIRDIEDFDLFDSGLVDILLDENEEKRIERDIELIPYRSFIQEINRLNINPDNVFSNSPEKRRVIKETIGYTKLNVPGGSRYIDECADERVGKAFQKIYRQAVKKLGLKNIKEKPKQQTLF